VKVGDVFPKFPPLPYASWQLHQIKARVRLNQIVVEYAHNEWSSIRSPGLLIMCINLSSSANQLEDVLPYATAIKDPFVCHCLPRPEVHSTCNFHSFLWLPLLLIWIIGVIQQSGFYTFPYPCKNSL